MYVCVCLCVCVCVSMCIDLGGKGVLGVGKLRKYVVKNIAISIPRFWMEFISLFHLVPIVVDYILEKVGYPC